MPEQLNGNSSVGCPAPHVWSGAFWRFHLGTVGGSKTPFTVRTAEWNLQMAKLLRILISWLQRLHDRLEPPLEEDNEGGYVPQEVFENAVRQLAINTDAKIVADYEKQKQKGL